MAGRESNDKRRRLKPLDTFLEEERKALADSLVYCGVNYHKCKPADYNFDPPCKPHPDKNLCDKERSVGLLEARRLFRQGVLKGLVSKETHKPTGWPSYVWAVDSAGVVYEAKPGNGGYHGYVLSPDDDRLLHRQVLKAWEERP